jgi:hypothetical protein
MDVIDGEEGEPNTLLQVKILQRAMTAGLQHPSSMEKNVKRKRHSVAKDRKSVV